MTDIVIRRFGDELKCLVFVNGEMVKFGEYPELLRAAGVSDEVFFFDFQKQMVIPEAERERVLYYTAALLQMITAIPEVNPNDQD